MNVERSAKCTIFVAIVCLPILIWFAVRSETNTHDLTIWLPSGTPERAIYDQFVTDFGSDENVLLSWSGCNVDGTELFKLKSHLLAADEHLGLFAQVSTTIDALQGLRNSNPGVSADSLKRQLRGVFLGGDLQTAGLVVRLSEAGKQNRKHAIALIESATSRSPKFSEKVVYIAGAPYVNVQIDRATNRSLLLAIPGGILAVLACFICLRSLRLAAITLFVAGFSALASVAIVAMFGCQLNGMLIVTPVLVLVLSLASGVHLSNYFRIARQSFDQAEATQQTIRHGWLPTAVAIVTTVMGFLTLCLSEIEAVRHFSLFSSASLLIALLALLKLFPALLLVWPEKLDWSTRDHDDIIHRIARFAGQTVGGRPAHARRASTVVVLFSTALGVAAAIGLPRIRTDLAPERLFSSSHSVSQNYRWLAANFIPLNSLELIVTIPNSASVPWHEQIETVRRIQKSVGKLPFVRSSFSVAQLVPRISASSSGRSTIQRSLFDSRFNGYKVQLAEDRWLAENDGHCAWRIWLGIDSESDNDPARWLTELDAAARFFAPLSTSDIQVAPTGMWLLSTIGRERLFNELTSSFTMAFALITPLVIVMLRSFFAGLVAMLPNLLPAIVFFGVLGWFGANVDISTILTASVGMGIAVDSTVHFLQWYRAETARGVPRIPAVANAIENCARAMFYTTLISCVGLVTFAFSNFLPARQFSLALITMLVLALICDLFVTPALILSPIGFLYDRRTSNRTSCRKLNARSLTGEKAAAN